MKISNSKKQLAKIISENGGWPEGAESAAQCIEGEISFWHDTATKRCGEDWCGSYLGACDDIKFTGVKLPNWHQTLLSRDEYFHLYPAPDADGWIEWKGGECPVPPETLVICRLLGDHEWKGGCPVKAGSMCWDLKGILDIIAYRLHKPEQSIEQMCSGVTEQNKHAHVDAHPTIEQLAAEYRNRLDYAERKQQEADAAKADADVKLAELVAAGKAVGLAVSVAAPEPEQRLRVFHNKKLGPNTKYSDTVRFELCEECGHRFGVHFGDANNCPAKEADNA